MKRNKKARQQRDARMNEDYIKMDKQGYRNDKIIKKLSKKYSLKPRTIYAILSGEYEKRDGNK